MNEEIVPLEFPDYGPLILSEAYELWALWRLAFGIPAHMLEEK